MPSNGGNSSDPHPPPGVVELREDIPLKAGSALQGEGSSRCCGGGPRFILACFAFLTAAITLALLTQIYYGDYELVPHGSVSSSAAACSSAGTDVLKAGGRSMDAAAASALCLAVLAPHRTSLDASGSLLYWEYRTSHDSSPLLAEWGGPGSVSNLTSRPPRLLVALASLHARFGALPWSRVLQPAIDLARNGFVVSDGLAGSSTGINELPPAPGSISTAPQIAAYLQTLQANTSAEWSVVWGAPVVTGAPHEFFAARWRMFAGGAGAPVAGAALSAALQTPVLDSDVAFQKVVSSLQQASLSGGWPPGGVATGLAVVDRIDTYVALVTGLSKPFGSGPVTPEGWLRDEPGIPLDLAPAIIIDDSVCGTRYVVGAESSAALAQGAAALLTSDTGAGAVERPRVAVYAGGVLGIESTRIPPEALPSSPPAPLVNETQPYAAVNVVQQKVDDLTSHADSRGGGLASRF